VFPQIIENTKSAVSTDEVRNRVYQIETRRYFKKISQSPVEFKSDASSFGEFLENYQKKKRFRIYRWLKGMNRLG